VVFKGDTFGELLQFMMQYKGEIIYVPVLQRAW